MDGAAQNDDQLIGDELVKASAAYEGNPGDIAPARDLARAFLVRLQSVHGLPVSERAMDMVQLVVSELLTSACKYAHGPCMLDLQLNKGRVEVTVWDSAPVLPVPKAPDPGRVGLLTPAHLLRCGDSHRTVSGSYRAPSEDSSSASIRCHSGSSASSRALSVSPAAPLWRANRRGSSTTRRRLPTLQAPSPRA